jgi:hypothetical protein
MEMEQRERPSAEAEIAGTATTGTGERVEMNHYPVTVSTWSSQAKRDEVHISVRIQSSRWWHFNNL